MRNILTGFAAIAAIATTFSSAADAQNRVNWIGAEGVELDWDEGDFGGGDGVNWESAGSPPENFQPDRTFGVGEYGSISNGGIALIDHAIGISPADIRLGEDGGSSGTLAIRTGGSINVQAGTEGSGTLANGVGGSGTLILGSDLGAVGLQNYAQNDSSTLIAQLGSASFANPVTVSDSISLAGTLRLESTPGSGFVADAGDTWTIMQGAPVTNGFDSVEFSPSLISNPGQAFSVSTANDAVTVSVEQRLVVQVDRFTGETTLSNPAGHSTSIDLIGYTLRSNSPLLSDDGNWLSFTDDGTKPGWSEANPTGSALSELNPQGALTFASGESHTLGTPISIDNVAPLGTPRFDANSTRFSYQLPTGDQVEAGIQVVGRYNDLVLVVDPETGAATLQNQSDRTLELISYTVSSTSSSLLPGFSGSGLSDWNIANPTTSDLSELNTGDALVADPGFEAALGTIWDSAIGDGDDLLLSYQTASGGFFQGSVSFDGLAVVQPGLVGDYNNDGVVNAADYTVWRDAEGSTDGLQNDPIGGTIGTAQYTQWSNNYGAIAASAASSAATPEPNTSLLVMAASICWLARRGS